MTEQELIEKIATLFKNAREEGAIQKWADGISDADEVLALVKEALPELAKKEGYYQAIPYRERKELSPAIGTGFTGQPTTGIGGTTDVGSCCRCDLFDRDGNLIQHIPQFTLFMCLNPGCNHYICEKHRQPCGFCEGCCAEEHGLDSH